jgi:hypothetical protein
VGVLSAIAQSVHVGLIPRRGLGLGDNHVWEDAFDATGNRIKTWFLDAFGAVKSLVVSIRNKNR